MPRQCRPRHRPKAKRPTPDNSAVAAALFGPLHAYVCQYAQGVTSYYIRFVTKLPKRTVDAALESLVTADLVTIRGLKYYHATIPYKRIAQTFGPKYAAALVVYDGIPAPRKRRRRRPIQRYT